MNSTAKVLIPEKEWLLKKNGKKIGALSRVKKGYVFYHNGKTFPFKNLNEAKNVLHIDFFEENQKRIKREQESKSYSIYDYPCRSKPYEPVYNVKNKLPLFAKSPKSKSRYCAGYYLILRGNGWATSYCPKFITIQRYPYHGPFKTELEMKTMLNIINSQ
jgi:hypothetical protein